MAKPKKQVCRECGCTDKDCKNCIEKTGEPCFWVEKDLCSACAFKEEWQVFKTMSSKGDKVGYLLDLANVLSGIMEQIFIDNNVNHLDLKALPEEAYNKWQELHKRHGRLGKLMTSIING